MKRRLRHMLEAAGIWLLLALFRALPLDAASNLGSRIGRLVGPLLPAHRVAQANLRMAMPELTDDQRQRVLERMWDNLGRVAAEFPHLPGETLAQRIRAAGLEHTPPDGQAALFISGHLGNWELLPALAHGRGVPLTLVYRAANNPYVDRMIARIRATRCADMFPKGHRGAAKMARAIKRNASIAMLIDQKMNDGIPVPFFGRDAMTAPAVAQLALRYGMPIVPVRVMRAGGAHFSVTVFPPLQYPVTGDGAKDEYEIMRRINALLEEWIRETPEQWLWVHRRWPRHC